MECFLKRSRGSITIMLTVILVPVIFFTGFLTDLARIKMYSSQAVMTADDYGDAVISQYDNVLKEMYGLFSVAQSEEGTKAISELDEYVKSSFDPTSSPVSWEYSKDTPEFSAAYWMHMKNNEMSGFMPYKSADVDLSYTPVQNASLNDDAVLSTQIGDFMKFRIAQELADGGDDAVIKAVTMSENMKSDMAVVNARNNLTDKLDDLLDATAKYYQTLDQIKAYPDYITSIQNAYADAHNAVSAIAESDHYMIFYDYTTNQEEIQAALDKQTRIQEAAAQSSADGGSGSEDGASQDSSAGSPAAPAEELTDEDRAFIAMNDAYQNDPDAQEDKLQAQFDQVVSDYSNAVSDPVSSFGEYDGLTDDLTREASDVKQKFEKVKSSKETLDDKLSDANVSEKLKSGVNEEMKPLSQLFKENDASVYGELASYVSQNDADIAGYQQNCTDMQNSLKDAGAFYMGCPANFDSVAYTYVSSINTDRWKDFTQNADYLGLYNDLKAYCADADDKSKAAKEKKNQAKDSQEKTNEELTAEETTSARDIPPELYSEMHSNSNTEGKFDLGKVISKASCMFNLSDMGEKLLNKFLLVGYDFGMFSSRVTNVKNPSGNAASGASATGSTSSGSTSSGSEAAESLTGIEMCRQVNYLYQAELEYILGGHTSSKENLEGARNNILTFRAIVNFTATYQIPEVDGLIRTASGIAMGINPLLGIAVEGALRLAVAGIETVGDWKELKSGESVALIKQSVADMTAADQLKDLIGDVGGSAGTSDSFRMDYNQYLMVMIVFLQGRDPILQRTRDLVTLNVNTVQQNIGADGTLSKLDFNMKNTVTAVNATCAVHLDFVVIPEGFAQKMTDDSTYTNLKNFEKNKYRFSVTRGY